MRGSPLLAPHGHHQYPFVSVLPTANGWLRLLLALAALLWLAFFLVMYNGLFRQEQLAGFGMRGCSNNNNNNNNNNQQEQQQRGGPPPADDTADAALRNELEELRRVNQELRQRLGDAERDTHRQREERRLRVEAVAERRRNVGGGSDKAVEEGEANLLGDRPQPLRAQSAPAAPTTNAPNSETFHSLEHELARRHLHNQILEMLYTLRGGGPADAAGRTNTTSNGKGDGDDRVLEQMLSLLADSELFGTGVDGAAAAWHGRELARLTSFIQSRLHNLQHPKDCSKARLLVCSLDKGCGLGCQLHHLSYCLVVAAASNRTMVLENDARKWTYSANGWTGAFLPIGNCTAADVDARRGRAAPSAVEQWWEGMQQNASVLILPIVDFLMGKPEQLPLSFPVELRNELLTHHGNPPAFFLAQFLHYLMRDNDRMKQHLAKIEAKIPFNEGPIVGLQIRRTDKVGTEAAYHSVEEYMRWTEYWFRIQQHIRDRISAGTAASSTFSTLWSGERQRSPADSIRIIKKRVFVATDDPSVVGELRSKYPEYEVYANEEGALTAQMAQRYSDASLLDVLADVRLLSRCSYLVCTFSSQVCRVGYELMQVIGEGDMANNFHSLDDIYYFGGQLAHDQVAIQKHDGAGVDQIGVEVGDVLGIAGNHWDGWSKGVNRRTGKSGLYPSYKAVEKWRIVPFPLFNLSSPAVAGAGQL